MGWGNSGSDRIETVGRTVSAVDRDKPVFDHSIKTAIGTRMSSFGGL